LELFGARSPLATDKQPVEQKTGVVGEYERYLTLFSNVREKE